jgi:superoxide dismutase
VITARNYQHLVSHLRGISDRALSSHLALYQQAVDRLNAIESAYPMVEWKPADAPTGDDATETTILTTPVSRLDLQPIGTLAECLETVSMDLTLKNIGFRPLWYLGVSDDDFWTADRAISVNIPWCFANPFLWRLANRGQRTAYTPDEMLRTLRHEAGHALCYAFEVWRDPEFREVFGDSRQPYREDFVPAEGSRDFVEYLIGVRAHYAQKHPDEDFAETFACWLAPVTDWRQQYADWPGALRKLQYIDNSAAAGRFSGGPPNTYAGRQEPYRLETRTVAEALGVGATPRMVWPTGWSEHAELLKAEPVAYNEVVLHEALFGAMGRNLGPAPENPTPGPSLAALAVQNWGSIESYLLDLRLCCAACGDGWALTVWDRRRLQLRNACVMPAQPLPVDCPVLVALDMNPHAYALDYGGSRHLGAASQLENLSWQVVETRCPSAGLAIGEPELAGADCSGDSTAWPVPASS